MIVPQDMNAGSNLPSPESISVLLPMSLIRAEVAAHVAVLLQNPEVIRQAAKALDSTHTWLGREAAMAYLGLPCPRTFRRKVKAWRITVSYALGNKEKRYQLASLQRVMTQYAIGLS